MAGTVNKMFKDMLGPEHRLTTEAHGLLHSCLNGTTCACSVVTEFLQILTDQANAASSEGGKNTITEAHVVKALKDLEFKHFAAQVEDLAQPAAKAPPRKKNKMKDSGLSQEELLRMQQELFAESKQKMGASSSASGPAAT
eukprot:scaffold3998_cov61-Phaeocystis_antarctica.AAC.9